MGQACKYNACAMDMIRDELRSNNITCLRGHEELHETVIIRLDKDNLPNSLCDIYEELCPNNFGRLIEYLTLVYQVADSCGEEIIREAVQRTVEDFKYIDLEKYKVMNPAIPFKALLGQPLLRAVVAYFNPHQFLIDLEKYKVKWFIPFKALLEC